MTIKSPLLQDLADMHRIHQERAVYFNACAYACSHLPLKTMLHRELDNTRDSIYALNKLFYGRFDDVALPEAKGRLYSKWLRFKPSFQATPNVQQVGAFEMADAVLLQCFKTMLARQSIENVTKKLLEFQYENHLALYESMKAFKTNPMPIV